MFPTNPELNLWTITTNADVEVDVVDRSSAEGVPVIAGGARCRDLVSVVELFRPSG